MPNVHFSFRRGAGDVPEILYGKVEIKPTLAFARGTSLVLPAPTTLDLVNGEATANNVYPTPAPVAGQVEWAYRVKAIDTRGQSFEWMVGVPDSTGTEEFASLPRYFETKPPLFGKGDKGDPGEAAKITVGAVTSGDNASVTNTGTNQNAVLDFVLPKGDKGDTGSGVALLPNDKPVTDLPATYPTGYSIMQVGSTANGWPAARLTVVTDRRVSGRTVQRAYTYNNTAVFQRTETAPDWTTFRELAFADVATQESKGLMSAEDKLALDNVGTLPYRSKKFTDLPSSYPNGSSTTLSNVTQDGWPNPSPTNQSFVQVTTTKSKSYVGGALQIISAYTEPNAPILYRIASSNDSWGEVKTIATTKDISAASVVVSVKDFGAVGDGVTDDTAAVQNLINNSSGKTVFFPAGNYKVSPMILSSSNVTIEAAPGAMITSDSGGNIFMFQGTVTDEKPLLWNISTGSSVVVVGTDHGLSVGDWIYIKSQRDALGVNAGDEWQLGYATPGSQGCYFAEFIQVAELPSADRVVVRQPVMFPSYRTDNTQETSVSSRPTSTWQKVSFVENVRLKNLKARTGGQLLRTQWARGVVFEGVDWECASSVGSMVLFQDSLECKAVRCEATYDTTMLPEVDHYKRNTFKSVGSHSCGFVLCKAVNATQPFDFSYFAGGGPAVRSFVIDCEAVGSQSNGMTSHGGTYILQVINNRFHGLRHGPSVRTRNSTIIGNTIEGYGVAGTIGIYLYEGWARDCVIANNNITGMDTGIMVRDAVDEGETFKYVGAVISGNIISKCLYGIQTTRSSGSTYWDERGIIIDSNQINLRDTTVERRGIWLGTGYRGVRITNNIIRNAGSPGTNSWGIYLNTNCTHNVIEGNSFIDMYFGVQAISPGTSSSGDGRIYASKNLFGSTNSSRHYVLGDGVVIWDGGWYGANQATRAASPGVATGSDATVINNLISSLRSRGLIT